MRTLYHWTMDPASRAIRLALAEKGLEFKDVAGPPGSHHDEVQRLLPGAAGPVLVDLYQGERVVAAGTHAALEFLDEAYPDPHPLLPAAPQARAEVRRIWHWSEAEFEAHVTPTLLAERLMQWTRRDHTPNTEALRKGAHALRGRLTFLNALAEERHYLAGRELSLADFIVAAFISTLDYFGDVGWGAVPDLREWYARVKSRPAFRPLLGDRLDGTRPAPHYADLDF